MIKEEFMEGLETAYSSHGGVNFNEEVLRRLWNDFGYITANHWKSICWDVAKSAEANRRPTVGAFYKSHKEDNLYTSSSEEQVQCRRCEELYIRPPEQYDGDDWCPKCIEWRESPAGKSAMAKVRTRWKNKAEEIGKRMLI